MKRRALLAGGISACFLAGCSTGWKVAYDAGIDPRVSKSWHVHGVNVSIPSSLRVSNDNTFAPNADIVWHGEPYGDRRAQVAAILREGVTRGSRSLSGRRGVRIAVELRHFHGVTPVAVSQAPGAVHNISYVATVLDQETGEPITEPQVISADLDAYVGDAAVVAAIEGQTQRVRIVEHIARVTQSWLGIGPDIRGRFSGVGR